MSDVTVTLVGGEARRKVRAGVKKVLDSVKLTLGPEGKNALLPRTYNRGPRITNDGYTVIENVRQLKDPHERLAAESFAEGSKRTNELAGDGTTATSVIAGNLFFDIINQLPDKDIPSVQGKTTKGTRAIRKELKDLKEIVIQKIKDRATKIETLEDLQKIARISIGKEDTKIADKVAQLVWDIGRDGDNFVDNHVDVVEGYKGEIEIEKTVGMHFPAKLAHRAFITKPERFEMIAEQVHVLITNHDLDNPFQLTELFTKVCVPNGVSKIALFAPKFSTPVIQSLIKNIQNGFFCYPVLTPALRTEQLEDLSAYTGATVIDRDKRKLLTTKFEDLGYAEKIIVKDSEVRDDAKLMGGRGEKTESVSLRKEILRGQLVEAKNDLSKMTLEKRIANLSSAMGVVRVGASTSAEQLFLKLKIEDGVFACKAALQEGYVKGGGLCLKEIAEEMDDNLMTQALKSPYNQIQENAGQDLEITDDVIDPAKVIRLQVEHAVEIAATLATVDILIADEGDRPVYDGYETVARAIAKGVYYDAKHRNLIKDSEDEAEADREKMFEEAILTDKG
jgi:chaperonin GroEL